MSPGQLVHDAVALAGEPDPDHPAIFPVRHPFHQPGGFGPVDELDRAVRPQQQVAGQVAHCRGLVPAVSFDSHQQLVLDVGQALGLSLILAPALEAPQGDPELEQPFEVLPGKPGHRYLPMCMQFRPRLPARSVVRRHWRGELELDAVRVLKREHVDAERG